MVKTTLEIVGKEKKELSGDFAIGGMVSRDNKTVTVRSYRIGDSSVTEMLTSLALITRGQLNAIAEDNNISAPLLFEMYKSELNDCLNGNLKSLEEAN